MTSTSTSTGDTSQATSVVVIRRIRGPVLAVAGPATERDAHQFIERLVLAQLGDDLGDDLGATVVSLDTLDATLAELVAQYKAAK